MAHPFGAFALRVQLQVGLELDACARKVARSCAGHADQLLRGLGAGIGRQVQQVVQHLDGGGVVALGHRGLRAGHQRRCTRLDLRRRQGGRLGHGGRCGHCRWLRSVLAGAGARWVLERALEPDRDRHGQRNGHRCRLGRRCRSRHGCRCRCGAAGAGWHGAGAGVGAAATRAAAPGRRDDARLRKRRQLLQHRFGLRACREVAEMDFVARDAVDHALGGEQVVLLQSARQQAIERHARIGGRLQHDHEPTLGLGQAWPESPRWRPRCPARPRASACAAAGSPGAPRPLRHLLRSRSRCCGCPGRRAPSCGWHRRFEPGACGRVRRARVHRTGSSRAGPAPRPGAAPGCCAARCWWWRSASRRSGSGRPSGWRTTRWKRISLAKRSCSTASLPSRRTSNWSIDCACATPQASAAATATMQGWKLERMVVVVAGAPRLESNKCPGSCRGVVKTGHQLL